jgi:hypothetical protein
MFQKLSSSGLDLYVLGLVKVEKIVGAQPGSTLGIQGKK